MLRISIGVVCLTIALMQSASGEMVFGKRSALMTEPVGRPNPVSMASVLLAKDDHLVLVRPRSNPATINHAPLTGAFAPCSPAEYEFSQVSTIRLSEDRIRGMALGFATSAEHLLFTSSDENGNSLLSVFSQDTYELITSNQLPANVGGGAGGMKVIGDHVYIYGPGGSGGAPLVVYDLNNHTSILKTYAFDGRNVIITDVARGADSTLYIAGADLGTTTPQAPFNAPDAKVFVGKLAADSLELESIVTFAGQVGPYFPPSLAVREAGSGVAVVFDKDTTIEKYHIAVAAIDSGFTGVETQIDLTELEDFGSPGLGRAAIAPLTSGTHGIVVGLPTGSIHGVAFDWETKSIQSNTRLPAAGEVVFYVGGTLSVNVVNGSPVWMIDEVHQGTSFAATMFTFCSP